MDLPTRLVTRSNPAQESSFVRSPRRVWALLLLLFFAVYFAALFSPALLDDADATHANAAQHMARTGDWVTLYVNGIRYLEKPALPYWLVAIDYHLFGYNVFATHLPMALAVLANAWLGWLWARRAFGDRAGFYAGLAILTTVGVFLFTRIFIPESILCFFLALSLWSFLTALEDRKPNRFYITYASLAIALLAKGLIAPVFFGAAVLPYLWITGDWRRWREFRLPTGILLFLAVGAPWHVMAAIRNPDQGHPVGNVPTYGNVHGFLYFYFVNEHFLRFLGKRYPHDYNKQPGWVFWVGHLAWLFPWCLFFPACARRLWVRRREWWAALHPAGTNTLTFLDEHPTAHEAAAAARAERFRARTTLLLGIYAVFILIFFSLSTNQEYYTWPAYFALLLLTVGSLAVQELRGGRHRWLRAAHWFLVTVGSVSALALAWGLWRARKLPFTRDIGTLMAHRGVGDYSLSMSHLFDLTGPSFAALRLPATIALVALLVGPIIGLLMRRRGRDVAATTSIGLTMAVFLIAAHIAFARFQPLLSSYSMATIVNAEWTPGDRLLVYGDQANASSLIFYTQHTTHQDALLVNGRTTSMLWGSDYPDAPHIFLNDTDLVGLWHHADVHGERLYLYVPPEQEAHVQTLIGGKRMVDLKELSNGTLYTNRPM